MSEQEVRPLFPPRVMMVWTDEKKQFVEEDTEGKPDAMEYMSVLEHRAMMAEERRRWKVTDQFRVRQVGVAKEKQAAAEAQLHSFMKENERMSAALKRIIEKIESSKVPTYGVSPVVLDSEQAVFAMRIHEIANNGLNGEASNAVPEVQQG